jgi:hypothetical protein
MCAKRAKTAYSNNFVSLEILLDKTFLSMFVNFLMIIILIAAAPRLLEERSALNGIKAI